MKLINEHISEVNSLCKFYGVKSLYVFGSIVHGRFNNKSDLDFVVELKTQSDPLIVGENLLSLWNGLEKTFARPVDLLTQDAIKNPILKKEIERTKVLVYEA